jgi:hypothetical protein
LPGRIDADTDIPAVVGHAGGFAVSGSVASAEAKGGGDHAEYDRNLHGLSYNG